MIEIRNLCKSYGQFRAVENLSLDVPTGQIVGLLGPNGAGKTTTIRIMTGYLPPTSGSVHIDGKDSVTQSAAVRASLGYLPEANPLYSEMRVGEYLRFRGRLYGLSGSGCSAAVDRVITRCWLGEMRNRLIGRLSKGFRQRVGLAASLLHSPKLLILDEPTSGLDPFQIRETRKLIRELAGEHTMIVSSHILPEIEVTCDRIIIMARGRVRADGSIAELRSRAGQAPRYRVEAQASPAASLADRVRALSGVASLEQRDENGWTEFLIAGKPGSADLREPLARLFREAGVLCRELHREADSLEQLFIRVTQEAENDAMAAKGAAA